MDGLFENGSKLQMKHCQGIWMESIKSFVLRQARFGSKSCDGIYQGSEMQK
jgi:hypothetical protein